MKQSAQLGVLLAALLGSGVLGWWIGDQSLSAHVTQSSANVEVPRPEELVAPGAKVESSVTFQHVPSGPPALAVVSSLGAGERCASMAPRRFVEVFAFEPKKKLWARVLHSAEWPLASPLIEDPGLNPLKATSIGDLAAGRADCLAIRDVTILAARMRPDRDYLAVQTFAAGGFGTGTGRLSLIGWLEGDPSLLYSDSRVGPIKGQASGSKLTTLASLYLGGNPNCCPSGDLETEISWSTGENRIAVAASKPLPFCTEGTISKFDYRQETQGGTDGARQFVLSAEYYLDVECSRNGPRGTFKARTTYALDERTRGELNLGLGDRVKVTFSTSKSLEGFEYYVTRGWPEPAPSKLHVTGIFRVPEA